jgi:CheY-like chemotaxis protein
MNTILFVDDDLNRRDKFDKKFGEEHHIWMVDNPLEAIENIRSRVYDVIFLDHDLGSTLDGRDVARCFYQSKNLGASVCVHSVNHPAAAEMCQILDELEVARVLNLPFIHERFWWLSRKFIVGGDLE